MRNPLPLLALAAAVALSGCAKQVATTDPAFGAQVRAYLLQHPEVIKEAIDKYQSNQVAEAAAKTLVAARENRSALEHDPRDFVANPGGKITVVEFYDYQCAWCKAAAPEMVKLVKDNPDVRFVFKEYVVFGPTSEDAARAVLGASDQKKYLDLYGQFMAAKPISPALADQLMTKTGLDTARARENGKSEAVTEHIADNIKLGATLGLMGTPSFFVGGKEVVTVFGDSGAKDPDLTLPGLRAAIAAARSAKT